MALYEYKCECGNVFEKIRPMSESEELGDCEKCGKKAKKIVSGIPMVQYKGAGFYSTDYAGRNSYEKQLAGELGV